MIDTIVPIVVLGKGLGNRGHGNLGVGGNLDFAKKLEANVDVVVEEKHKDG